MVRETSHTITITKSGHYYQTTLRTRLKTGTKFSGFGTYYFWLVLILAILTLVLHNSHY